MARSTCFAAAVWLLLSAGSVCPAAEFAVTESDEEIKITTPQLEAAVRKKGYVSGVAAQSFLDKKTGFRDAGFGLDIVDWIMEPGSDEAYRDKLDPELVYHYGILYHGQIRKRSLEGPQICTQARQLQPAVIRGKDFVAVRQDFKYRTAAPGKKTGSAWTQVLVFPAGKRYFVSMDKIDAVNSSEAMFLRIDMPGHVRHQRGDTFGAIYLSYSGTLPADRFFEDFPPDGKYIYRRGADKLPDRFIRAYQLRDPKTGKSGPWLAGMTLEPSVVSEAWCHQRGYVCMIEEFGGRPIKAGESFSAAFVVGYFDSIDEMHQVYDQHKGHTRLEVSPDGWKLMKPADGATPTASLEVKNPELVAEVKAGKRLEGSAAWWGFDPADATEALQAAVDSGAKKLIVPDMGKPWIVSRTIRLASNQEIVFEAGVVLAAMRGKFLAPSEPLVQAAGRQNITLRGEGATFRMNKEDYTKPPYKKGEWRHTLEIVGSTNVQVLGLTLRDSGGDGIYLGATQKQNYCRDIVIRNVTCDNNHRQGISVISAENLLIEDCRLLNTRGTAPQAGIDLEPNLVEERLVNCVIRRCLVEDNVGPGIYGYLKPLSAESRPLSIRIEGCTVRRCGAFGIGVGAIRDAGPKGLVQFEDVAVEGIDGPGAYVFDKSAEAADVRFVRCTFKDTARKRGFPIALDARRDDLAARLGGVELVDCLVEDRQDRPFLATGVKSKDVGLSNVRGTIKVNNPHGARVELPPRQQNVAIKAQ